MLTLLVSVHRGAAYQPATTRPARRASTVPPDVIDVGSGGMAFRRTSPTPLQAPRGGVSPTCSATNLGTCTLSWVKKHMTSTLISAPGSLVSAVFQFQRLVLSPAEVTNME